MKRQGNRRATPAPRKPRTTKRSPPLSAKALEIVALVEAISADCGVRNGVVLGRGIARLLAETYGRNGKQPAWVRDIVAHYIGKPRES
ncbi:MAG TPA: hypothetical protein VFD76_11000 [Gemmatimonadales bacterium]|nr:hypothetical protein [Gemmatimonadales bacterium]